MRNVDITGKKFNNLTAIRYDHKNDHNVHFWLFKCDCGKEKVIRKAEVLRGRVTSCGCAHKKELTKRNKKHDLANTTLYSIWSGMKCRCFNKNVPKYKIYGARGITVCDEWKNDFMSFYNWAIENGYKEGLTIDRIDNNGNYCPENCRWATLKQQARNRRTNRNITYKGITLCATEWGELIGINPKVILHRLSCGWSVEKVLSINTK